MKRQSLLLFMSALLLLVSCQEKIVSEAVPQISIERVASDDTVSVTVRFVPGENAAYYRYAIGQEEDYDSFVAGIMETMGVEESSESREVVFSDLEPGRTYTVFAQAFTESGASGSVATVKITPAGTDLNIGMQYVSDVSAGFKMMFSHNYYMCRYYLGKPGEEEQFAAGEIPGKTVVEPMVDYECVNYYDLVPETEYVFYYEVFDRYNISTGVKEIAFTTYKTGECPDVILDKNLGLYSSKITVNPGEGVYRMIVAFGAEGFADFALSNWANDAVAMFRQWGYSGYGAYIAVNKSIEAVTLTSPVSDQRLEMYVMLEEEDGTVVSVRKYVFVNHEVDPSLGVAKVDVQVSDINAKGATYTFTPDENTFGYYYDTVDADWYDDLVEKGEADEYYLHNYMLNDAENGKFTVANGEYTWTEFGGEVNTRYYAVACPMNGNGAGEGWGPLCYKEYVTK